MEPIKFNSIKEYQEYIKNKGKTTPTKQTPTKKAPAKAEK